MKNANKTEYTVEVINNGLLENDYPCYRYESNGDIPPSYRACLRVTPVEMEFTTLHCTSLNGRNSGCVYYTVENGENLTAQAAEEWLCDNAVILYDLQKSINGFDYDYEADKAVCEAIEKLEESLLYGKTINIDNYLQTVSVIDLCPEVVNMNKKSLDKAISYFMDDLPWMNKYDAASFFEQEIKNQKNG